MGEVVQAGRRVWEQPLGALMERLRAIMPPRDNDRVMTA